MMPPCCALTALTVFGHQAPRLVGGLGQVAFVQMFPGAGAEILAHAGVFLSGAAAVQTRLGPVAGGGQAAGNGGGNVRGGVRRRCSHHIPHCDGVGRRQRALGPEQFVKPLRKLIAEPQAGTDQVHRHFGFIVVDLEAAGRHKGGVDPLLGFRIAGASNQLGQFCNHFSNGAVGVDDAAMVRADGLDRFRNQFPRLVGCLVHIALFQVFPGAGAEVLSHAGVLLRGETGILHRIGPVISGGQSAGNSGGDVVGVVGGCSHRIASLGWVGWGGLADGPE